YHANYHGIFVKHRDKFKALMNHPHKIEANQHLSILFLSLVPSELVTVFIAADIPKKKYNALINEFLFELHQDLFENGKLSVIL
ncbi:22441_t:CDS:2, partial [Rhizophagus irregularis]